MAERLPVIRLQPTLVLDWCASSGASREVLARAYPRARVVAVEPDGAPPEVAVAAPEPRSWLPWPWRAKPGPAAQTTSAPAVGPPGQAGQAAQAVQAVQAGLVWANMALHHVADPQAEMRHWQRALQVDGFLMFSTLGPGSLALLREVYREAGWPSPHAPFVDMHDLGDMLVEAGFADPVMDQEPLTLTYDDPARLLAELRGLGGNADPARTPGLRTPRWRARLLAALRERAIGGRIRLGFEVVYGHAFRPAPRLRLDGEARLAPEELLAMARSGRLRRSGS